MTSTPTLGTVRRWLNVLAAEGLAERKDVQRTGKPGRPAVLWGLTEKGLAQPRVPPAVEKVRMERLRRQENLRKRRRAQRNAGAIAAAQAKAAKASRRLRAAQAEVELITARIIDSATARLAEANGDASVLLPEEVDLLLEHRCAYREGDRLLLDEEWAKAWRLAHENNSVAKL